MVLRRQVHGETDPRLLQSFCSLGVIAFRQGQLDEATWLFVQVRDIVKQRGLDRTPRMARVLNDLGVIARNRGDDDEAGALYAHRLGIGTDRLLGGHCRHLAEALNAFSWRAAQTTRTGAI